MPATVELDVLKAVIISNGNTLTDTTGLKQVVLLEWMKIEPLLPHLIGVEGKAGLFYVCGRNVKKSMY